MELQLSRQCLTRGPRHFTLVPRFVSVLLLPFHNRFVFVEIQRHRDGKRAFFMKFAVSKSDKSGGFLGKSNAQGPGIPVCSERDLFSVTKTLSLLRQRLLCGSVQSSLSASLNPPMNFCKESETKCQNCSLNDRSLPAIWQLCSKWFHLKSEKVNVLLLHHTTISKAREASAKYIGTGPWDFLDSNGLTNKRALVNFSSLAIHFRFEQLSPLSAPDSGARLGGARVLGLQRPDHQSAQVPHSHRPRSRSQSPPTDRRDSSRTRAAAFVCCLNKTILKTDVFSQSRRILDSLGGSAST